MKNVSLCAIYLSPSSLPFPAPPFRFPSLLFPSLPFSFLLFPHFSFPVVILFPHFSFPVLPFPSLYLSPFTMTYSALPKVLMQGNLFQRCTHLLYCGNVNTRRMSKPDMGSIFYIKKSMKYSGHRKLLCEFSKLSKLMLLTSADTKRP